MTLTALILFGLVFACTQVALLREALAAAGGSEPAVALGLTLWLLGTAAGAGLGSVIPARRARVGLAVLGLLAGMLPFGALLLLRGALRLLQVPPGELLTLAQQAGVLALALGPVCLCGGAAFTLACRLPEAPPRTVYLAEAGGWLLGGLLSTWGLVWLSPFLGQYCLLFLMLLAIDLLARPRVPLLAALGLPLLFAVHVPGQLEARSRAWLWPAQQVLACRYTPHGQAAVLDYGGQCSLYLDGHLAQTLPEPQTAEELAHLALLQPSLLRRVLLVGGLGGLLPEVLKYPVGTVVLAEEDRAVTALAVAFADDATRAALRDPRVRVIYGDPRRTMTGWRWDAVLAGVPPPSTLATNRFFTRGFFVDAYNSLYPGGVLAVSLPGSDNYYDADTLRRNGAVYRALAAVFPHVLLAPRATNYLLASDAPLCGDPVALGRRLEGRHIATTLVNADYFAYLLGPDDARALAARYAATPAVNRDLQPVAPLHDLLLWSKAEPGRLGTALARVAGWPPAATGALLLGCLLLGALLPAGGRPRAAWRLLAVTAAGWTGMALGMLLLFLAGTALGALYSLLGALTALGMAGMALGAWTAGRRPRPLWWPLAVCLLLLLALPLLAPLLAAWPFPAAVALLGVLEVLAGMTVGMVFPLAVADGSAPAAVYAADLLGAAPAALLTGALLLPIHGLTTACLLLAIVPAVGMAAGRWRSVPTTAQPSK
jgi:spermidine synthase